MSNQSKLPAREYNSSDAAMLVGIGAITLSALEHQPELVEEDTTLTTAYLQELKGRIDEAGQNILGHDNAKDLRAATAGLHSDTDDALDALSSMRNIIKTKYRTDSERGDEILTNLGFTALYTAATHKDQLAIGQLLSRATTALEADGGALAKELTGKGMNVKRIDTVTSLGATFMESNTAQKATKGTRKVLSATDVETLNDLYHEALNIAKIGRHFFRDKSALRSLFVFSKVAPASQGHDDTSDNIDPAA